MRHRLLGILCLLYLGVLMYASLAPFDFSATAVMTATRFELMWQQWPFVANARVSGSDALSNILLYIPLGALAAGRCRLARRLPGAAALIAPVVLAGMTSAAVEILQAYSTTRIPSVLDWILNVFGAFAGAIAGTICGRAVWIRSIRWLRLRWNGRPAAVAAVAMIVLLATDAMAPFMPTILLTDVWRNLKRSHFNLMAATALHTWHWWLVARIGVFAILTSLLAAAGQGPIRRKWRKWLRAAAMALCLAIGLEVCKLLIAGRHFDIANIAFSAVGCSLALAAGPLLTGRLTGTAKVNLGIMALTAYLAYPRYFPLYHHSISFTLEDVRLFVSTAILCGGLVCMCRIRWSWLDRPSHLDTAARAIALSTSFGLVLELGQSCLSPWLCAAAVLPFVLGGALGAWIRLPGSVRTVYR